MQISDSCIRIFVLLIGRKTLSPYINSINFFLENNRLSNSLDQSQGELKQNRCNFGIPLIPIWTLLCFQYYGYLNHTFLSYNGVSSWPLQIPQMLLVHLQPHFSLIILHNCIVQSDNWLYSDTCNRTFKAENHTRSAQLNPPITELIAISKATATYPKKRLGNFQNGRIFN